MSVKKSMITVTLLNISKIKQSFGYFKLKASIPKQSTVFFGLNQMVKKSFYLEIGHWHLALPIKCE